MASDGKSVAVMAMPPPPPAAPPNFEKYRDADTHKADNAATETEAAGGVEGGVDADSRHNSADPKVSAAVMNEAADLN